MWWDRLGEVEQALAQAYQWELWREVAMDQLARDATRPSGPVWHRLAARVRNLGGCPSGRLLTA
jgi:hypothetical protein